jgi:ribosomal protein S18 acetylase RimI-like enzyme
MATSPVASQIEVLDLRHFSARQLRPLLEREARVWMDRLRWNYESSTELLLQYLDSRILPGFVAVDRGRICGYSFCVYEGNKAVIGDAFACGQGTTLDPGTTQLLLTHMLELLRHTPVVDRIEAQLLLFNAGELTDAFPGPEFQTYKRLFLECDLHRSKQQMARDLVPPELILSSWTPPDYQHAGELIYACYAGHQDGQINDQYRSLHGSLRFLHNIVRFPGCGVFQPNFSWVLRERRTGALAGIVLASRIGAEVAHVTQLCVASQWRGRGLGSLLLNQCANSLASAGFKAITLTVTEANEIAVKLYKRFGFRLRHRFDAMVLDKSHNR